MAVKFSEFTAKLDASVDVTEVVGYLQTGELNVRIPPANLDTTYVVSTGNAGASPTINLQGTKPNQAAAIAPTTVSLTGSGATLLAGNGTTTIDFGSTSYALTSTDSVVGNNSVPVVLTGTGGNDVGTDTVTIVGTGNIQVSSATNVITINGTASAGGYTTEIVASATNISAIKDYLYILTNPSAILITLPANPTDGDTIGIANNFVASGGNVTNVLAANGASSSNADKIMGDTSNLVIDNGSAAFDLVFSSSGAPNGNGWTIVGAN